MTGSELLSLGTRRGVRNLTSANIPLEVIDTLWQGQGFILNFQDPDIPGLEFRARRFQGYMDQVDWADRAHVARAFEVFQYALRSLEEDSPFDHSSEMEKLRWRFEEDGYELTDDGRIAALARGTVDLTSLTQSSLSTDQMRLLDALYRTVTNPDWGPAMSWPNWNYVRKALSADGMPQHRADRAIATLPCSEIGSFHPYSLIWRSRSRTGQVQPNETIGLTMAGLIRVDTPAADGLARLARTAAEKEADLPIDPHEMPSGVWAITNEIPAILRARLGSHQAMNTPTTADLLKHEPVPLASDTDGYIATYEIRLGDGRLAPFLDVQTAQDYFRALDTMVLATPLSERETGRANIDGMTSPDHPSPTPPTNPRAVFLVHGRNEAARAAMSEFLRALDLTVLSWTQAVNAARSQHNKQPTTLETVQAGLRAAAAVVVLFTPDDLVMLDPRVALGESQLTGQARANVILEAGMIIGMAEHKALFVKLGKLRDISDIAGINFVNIGDSIDKKEDLADRLAGMKLPVDKNYRRMEAAGKFDAALSYLSEPPPL
jgi:predicted nucleotide-binding protein